MHAALLLGLGGLASAEPPRLPATVASAPHESPPTREWIKAPQPREAERSTAGLDGQCGFVERDGYVSVQVNVDLLGRNIAGDAANEPSIAIDPTHPRRMAIGWRQFDSIESDFRQAGYGYSRDGGQTWSFPGPLTPGVFGSDPVLDSDAEGNFYYLSINFEEVRLFKSYNQGVTWSSPIQVLPGFWDKPWMVVDRVTPVSAPYIYLTLHWPTFFSESLDGGGSFSEPFIIPGRMSLSNMALSVDGALYVSGDEGSFGIAVARRDMPDLGTPSQEFDMFSIADVHGSLHSNIGGPPNPAGLVGQVWIDTDRSTGPYSGNVYCVALVALFNEVKDRADVVFVRSEDRGETWSEPVRINDDPPSETVWQWFDTMSVAPNGRIDVVWNDTRNYPVDPSSVRSELFYAYSTDGGRTWSPNVAVGPAFDSYVGWPQQAKLGDYYHMRSDNLGVNVAYAATFNGEQDIWFLRIGPHDCNGNEVPDPDDIETGTSLDANLNDIPDECELFGDFNGDSRLDLRDYQGFQLCYDAPGATWPGPRCTRLDLDIDGDVDHGDYALWHGIERR